MTPEEFWSSNATEKAQKAIRKRATQLGLDFKALQVLFNTQWNLDGREGTWIGYTQVPPEDLAYAKSHGVMHDPLRLSHDAIVARILAARNAIDRRAVAAAFANSLVTRRLDQRSPLGSYAFALHLAAHPWQADGSADNPQCSQCGLDQEQSISVDSCTFRRIMWAGNLLHGRLDYMLCDLEAFRPATSDCSEATRTTLNNLLGALRDLSASMQLKELEKSLTGVFPSDKGERQVVLEILGYCGILQPKAYPSLRERWLAPHERPEPDHFYKKEWRSPVSCWTGEDGVNENAVAFWFGEFLSP